MSHARLPDVHWNLPRDKGHPPDAVQCDCCGGWGCRACCDRGWLYKGHAGGRTCAREDCYAPIPPAQVATYCSVECAIKDA